jgi:Hypothetical glycosyl hydrolase family 15
MAHLTTNRAVVVRAPRTSIAVLTALALVATACGAGGAEPDGAVDDAESTRQVEIGPSDTSATAAGTGDGCCGEGHLAVLVNAKSEFDEWTSGGHWAWMNATYDSMVVWEPYWDSRLDDFNDVFVSRNAYAINVDVDQDPRSVEHPEWILRNSAGAPVYIPFGCSPICPQYAADVGNSAFRQAFIDDIADLVARGYPGLMLDDVNLAWRFSDRRGEDIVPIDPRTGQALTLTDWQRYMAEFVELIRAEFPDLNIMHNTIWYVEPPDHDNTFVSRQITAADYLMLERGATDPGLVHGTSTFGMRSFLDYIDEVHALGTNVLLLDETATTVGDQWFNLVAGLLVNDGHDLVGTEDWDRINPEGFWSGFATDLGDALGPRYVHQGLHRRDFTDGIVLLNEPGRDTVTVSLEQPMQTASGQRVTSITLDGRAAAVLFRPGAATPIDGTTTTTTTKDVTAGTSKVRPRRSATVTAARTGERHGARR